MEHGMPKRLRGLGLVGIESIGVKVPAAAGPVSRLLGLAFLDISRAGPGLLLPDCRSVHTFGMRFHLDVHFIDGSGCVVRTERSVGPRRILFEHRADHIVEIPSPGGETVRPGT
jgi:hypothetical protein